MINDMPNQELIIETAPGQAVRFPSYWLRDHCQCSECSHSDTRQRQLDTFSLDPSVKATKTTSADNGTEITWSDGHASQFSWTWLQKHTPFPTPVTTPTTRHQQTRQWKPSIPATPLQSTDHGSVMSSPFSEGLRQLVTQIHTYGFAFISNTPASPFATEALLNHIAPIRVTHYGGFWDFTSVVNPIDTAYTNDFLPNHTDTTYFTDPAGLQLFHLLSHVPASTFNPQAGDYTPSLGGESTFVDGFAAASKLYEISPASYQYLSTVPIVSHASGSPAGSFCNASQSAAGYPVLIHHSPSLPIAALKPENLTCVRWNNLDRSPLTQFPTHQAMLSWYKAAKLWSEILSSKEFEIEVALKPGEPVLFDNWRVLHGRKAFEGKRRVCGGYHAMDDFRAKGRALGLDI